MKLTFDVTDNVLKRTDKIQIINQNKNIYKAVFNFSSSDDLWLNENIFVIFEDSWGNKNTIHLGKNNPQLSAGIPARVLEGTYFKVSVYAGDLITTNTVTIPLKQSRYRKHFPCRDEGYEDIFVEIFDRIDSKFDDVIFQDKCLHFYNDGILVDSVYLDFVDESLVEERIQENKITVDSELSSDSDNPVSNRVITDALENKADCFDFVDELDTTINNLIGRV